MGIDLSKVDRLELRREIATDLAKGKALMQARANAREPIEDEQYEAFRKLREKHDGELRALGASFDERFAAAEAPHMEALNAWMAIDYAHPLRTDEEMEPLICAASGLPIFEDDDVIEDADDGQFYLRSALGLPPLPGAYQDTEPGSVPEPAGV